MREWDVSMYDGLPNWLLNKWAGWEVGSTGSVIRPMMALQTEDVEVECSSLVKEGELAVHALDYSGDNEGEGGVKLEAPVVHTRSISISTA